MAGRIVTDGIMQTGRRLLKSHTDFTTYPDGARILMGADTDVLGGIIAGAGGWTLAMSHTDQAINAARVPAVGLIEPHESDYWCHEIGLSGFTNINNVIFGGGGWQLRCGYRDGPWGKLGLQAGGFLNFDRGTNQWRIHKWHQLPGTDTAVESNAVVVAPPTTVVFKVEIDRLQGYKVSYNLDGAGYVELGAGAVPIGWVDIWHQHGAEIATISPIGGYQSSFVQANQWQTTAPNVTSVVVDTWAASRVS